MKRERKTENCVSGPIVVVAAMAVNHSARSIGLPKKAGGAIGGPHRGPVVENRPDHKRERW